MITDSVTLKVNNDVKQKLQVIDTAKVNFTQDQYVKVVSIDADKYEGAYEYVPTGETQVIDIKNKIAKEDIVINPIPSNYGLITWDGTTLTVS